jgi:hypothetical protein
MVRSLIASGKKNENALTDAVFRARHPELAGASLTKGSPQAMEWLAIRDEIVRPALAAPAGTSREDPHTEDSTSKAAPAEPGLIEQGLHAVMSFAESAYHTAVDWFSSGDDATPAASGPGKGQKPTEGMGPQGGEATRTAEPSTASNGATAKVPALSQFIWYGADFQDLGATEVAAVSKVLSSVFGIGSSGELITEPDESVKKKNPNQGYWWFRADGTPAWNGESGGTQYVLNNIDWSLKLNDVSAYLSSKPPGARPAFMKDDGTRCWFGNKQEEGWVPVPDEARNLKLRNVPGGASCFATSEAMMSQAGVHAVGSGNDAEIKGIITSETYTTTSADRKPVATVTVDAAASLKAKTYIDWETKRGKPVFTGVSYTNRNGNTDTITDHWVVIDTRIGDGQYSFHDPGTSSTKDAGSDSNVFVWDGEKLQNSGKKKYIVSWVRPNQESLVEWAQFWAAKQQAPDGEPSDAAKPTLG